ncbi:MAG: DEAD/DEAH box helicase [Candidatus Accumulibacter sp.]|uniref:DEAD/DEAH box helicase n=1 Tax=Accumulibacter sp. TaxID=2053492 RepID=UPI002879F81E|nr:DEAD/DEAH box helicase [Accumulibacter sp.]MDS4014172.1 DEAD/DEAH box helicase [Accumulibacter sp.]
MTTAETLPPPGARVLVRDEEWLVRNTDQCTAGGHQVRCIGVSELVRNREAVFLTLLDRIETIDPRETELVADPSPGFTASLLYLEARLRQTVPATDELVLGHRAVMDALPFQLDPAHRVLQQLRPRLLIADTVGLGKTLEAGILTAELIRRGKGRRILVVTTRAMMRQFQQEFWSRFAISLTRLDADGIQRIRRRIPANHNPFQYLDRTIISVDTLKRDGEYRHHLENAWWDIIIIDEAHNVSFKGNRTQSNRLADLLARRSDALLLLTATPHNGKRESFASLVRMLDPTVLPAGADYTRHDVEHLFVRRFKRDVREQIRREFPEREVCKFAAQATPAENAAFDALRLLRLKSDEGAREGSMLFRTTLEKSLFSSPAACLDTLDERLRRTRGKDAAHPDLAPLQALRAAVAAIGPEQFSKFNELVRQLRGATAAAEHRWRWDGKTADDRLVVFTERLETLNFLHKHLPRALGLPASAVAILHGQLADGDLQKIVEDFGKTLSPLRLLIASDVASEGLNLHYCAHRLVHFDIPWSLMVFQQRNGRVDRYGQTRTPRLAYCMTEATDEKIRGDLRILEILIDKDAEAARNIGDPSSFMGLYDEDLEVEKVAETIEQATRPEAFSAWLDGTGKNGFALLDELFEQAPPMDATTAEPAHAADRSAAPVGSLPSLFADDFAYARAGLACLHRLNPREQALPRCDEAKRSLALQPNADLAMLLERELAPEMWPSDNVFALSSAREEIDRALRHARDTQEWPAIQYLWPIHPLLQWLDYKMLALFGRQKAPVLKVARGLAAGEAIVLVTGQIPNRRGQSVLAEWLGVHLDADGAAIATLSLDDVLARTGLGRSELINDGVPIAVPEWQRCLAPALDEAAKVLREKKRAFDAAHGARLSSELDRLRTLRQRHLAQIEFDFAQTPGGLAQSHRMKRAAHTDDLFAQYQEWAGQTLKLDERAQFTVLALLVAGGSAP